MCLGCLGASECDPQQSSLLPGYLSSRGLAPSSTGLLKSTVSLQKASVFLLQIKARDISITSNSCLHSLSPRNCRQYVHGPSSRRHFHAEQIPQWHLYGPCFIILQGKVHQPRKKTFTWILIQKICIFLWPSERKVWYPGVSESSPMSSMGWSCREPLQTPGSMMWVSAMVNTLAQIPHGLICHISIWMTWDLGSCF